MKIKQTRFWKAIFRTPFPHDRPSRISVITKNFFLHLHPAHIREYALKIKHTWCMGGITAFLLLVECITGILLMFYYRPSPEFAYHDIVALREQVSFGIVREIHRWAGHLIVITVWLHMLRVFLVGAYKPPREFNWVVGVVLLVLTMLLSFTGYLLPWDQLSMWAVTVGSHIAAAPPVIGSEGPLSKLISPDGIPLIHAQNDPRFLLLGDTEVSGATLLRFYVLHCIALPAVLLIMMGVHFWRVRKDRKLSEPL
jgi:quinol-cytochrome oxidoreductase complex cytochrome b subunit